MWVIDIRHWLNESQTGPATPQLKSKVKKLARIISYATSKAAGISPGSRPKCWRRPKKKRCKGTPDIFLDRSTKRIHWSCPVCGDEGVVYGWEGLIWDKSEESSRTSSMEPKSGKKGSRVPVYDPMEVNTLNFKDISFSRLLELSDELSSLREEYADKSAEERRAAADYRYHSSIAESMMSTFDPLFERPDEQWPGEVEALAIDPTYAPAILTVGSYEYLFGRKEEGMALFLSLTRLPENTEELAVIINKAGEFLFKNGDIENATRLYETATIKYPEEADFHDSLSYCYAVLGELEKAIEKARLAVGLDPDNYYYLTDLGWGLMQTGEFEEAESILKKAVKLSPPEYPVARRYLKQLRRQKK